MLDTSQACKVLSLLAGSVDGSLAARVAELASAGDWESLQKATPLDPGLYTEAEAYYRDVVVNDFARKSPPVKGDLTQTAIDAFWACERANKLTNDRVDRFIGLKGPFEIHDTPFIKLIERWRYWVNKVLGRLPADLDLRFSSGATIGASGQRVSIPHKIDSVPRLYPGSRCLIPFIERTHWGRIHSLDYVTTRGNSFFSVPKDSKKDRGCCKEASGSVALQLALGRVLRRRLKAVDIDLDLGQDLHRQLAKAGSLGDHLATIDLSNASDLISYKVVKLILPEGWFQVLDSLRAPFTNVEGKWVRLEKFSSMGNGFTFELETMLYWGLIKACQELLDIDDQPYVYGDDMITQNQPEFLKLLYGAFGFFGFQVNKTKSYVSGPFRESCGGDYFSGTAVRPYFLKRYPTAPNEWIALHNGLVALERPDWTAGAREYCIQQIPKRFRLFGPKVLGDQVIHTPVREAWKADVDDMKWCGLWIRGVQPQFRKIPLSSFHPSVALASAVYGVPSGGVVPRQTPIGLKVRKTFVASSMLEWD